MKTERRFTSPGSASFVSRFTNGRAEGRSPGGVWSRGGGRSHPTGTATHTAGAAQPRPARHSITVTHTVTDTDRVRVRVLTTGELMGVARTGWGHRTPPGPELPHSFHV